jgi:tRNA dimethylallyltransferase
MWSSSVPAPTPCPAGASRGPATPDLPPLIVIAGATATGKTALAVALAQGLPGAEIVSADSRQVYRDMDIATAKPTADEMAAAPHHCLDLVDPDEPFTASDYQHAATEALRGIAARDGIALLVGGTGLYLRAVARGLKLSEGDTDPEVRAELNARFTESGLELLLTELEQRDPAGAASVDQRNPRRVIRALERAILTGSAAPPAPEGYAGPTTWLGLRLDPDAHRQRIRARIEEHFEAGLLDEAERLRARYPEDLPAFSAMGYREAFAVLGGRISVDEARTHDAQRTWAYARRQRTWFRAEPGIAWLDVGEGAIGSAAATLAPFLREIGRADYAGPT